MIQKFVTEFEKTVNSYAVILSSDIQKHFGHDNKTIYLKGKLFFIDSSILEIAIFASEFRTSVSIQKYRFHYMSKHGNMFFRYDNAPHHPEIPSFPHHKHIGRGVIPSSLPNIKYILDEISAIMLKR